ncbi:MAG: alpha/beta fold hydrolase [Gammaproteobacteria bacterium]
MATFVLIHGGWHGGWCWREVVPLIERAGHRAIAPDLPGMGEDRTALAGLSLAHWARRVAQIVESAGGDVILAGHSRGGLVVSQTAELCPRNLRALAYVAAFLLPDGAAISPLAAYVDPAQRLPILAVTPQCDAVRIDPAAARERFYNTTPPALADWALSKLCPEPIFGLVTPAAVTPERFGRYPRSYVECLRDQTIVLGHQRAMQAAWPCARVSRLDCDHSPFLSAPEALANALVDSIARS